MAIKASGETKGLHTVDSTSGQEAVNEDWAFLPVAVEKGQKSPKIRNQSKDACLTGGSAPCFEGRG